VTNSVAATLIFVVLIFAADVPAQCSQPVYARTNPGLCGFFPFPDIGGGAPSTGGGGGGGGILGGVGKIIGGLTGGLL
jgi:hypothetical protein